jgi:hypothetical protein
MRKGICLISIVALLFAIILMGCQKTPEIGAVVNKGNDDLQRKINSDALSEQKYEVPPKWNIELTDSSGSLSLLVDAEVIAPDVDSYPVSKVQKIDITEEYLKNLVNKLSNGGTAYEFKDETVFTKDEIAEIIINLKKELSDLNSNLNTATISKESYDQATNEIKKEIRDWEEYYPTAPETFELKEKEIKFSLSNTQREQFVCGLNLGKANMAQLQVTKTDAGGYISFSNFDKGMTLPFKTTSDLSSANNLKLTKDEAVKVGFDFLSSFDLKDYGVSLALIGYMDPSSEIDMDGSDYKDFPQCYVLYFTKTYAGVQTTFRDSNLDGFLTSDSMSEKLAKAQQYAPFWPQESIELIIADSGIQYMYWTMPTEQVDVVNTNVELLPFSDIQRIFKNQVMIDGIWTNPNDPDMISRKITITKAILGMMQIREKDTYDGLLMVPTWNFYGYETYKYAKPVEGGFKLAENNEYVNDQIEGHSFYTINAIDGSIINPILGY